MKISELTRTTNPKNEIAIVDDGHTEVRIPE